MRITASEPLTLTSEYRLTAAREVRESLDLQTEGSRLQYQREERQFLDMSANTSLQLAEDQPRFSPQALRRLAAEQAPRADTPPIPEAANAAPLDLAPSDEDAGRLRMLLLALAWLNGDSDALLEMAAGTEASPADGTPPSASTSSQPAPPAPAFSLRYDYQSTTLRAESLSVAISGQVQTADGRQIDLALSVQMQRVEVASASISLRAGAALKDPLVVNLGSGPVQLDAKATTSFDLDADGSLENMALLSGSSAFLALDRNGNTRIDNGRELFGALSGNGFADLAGYDEDGNGFIDEGDSVFSQLQLWRPGANGGQLTGLQSAGIGALALANAQGNFDLVSGDALQGRVRGTGVFLYESGAVGSLQQIDLAV